LPQLGILSALLDEQRGLLDQLESPVKVRHAGRTFWQGRWHGVAVVLALTRVGKVAAATTTAALIERFGVQQILFTGVAGGVGAGVRVGDVVVAQSFIQHDLDSRPLFPRYEIPLYGRSTLPCDAELSALLVEAVDSGLVRAGGHCSLKTLDTTPQRHQGLIASGDCFVGAADHAARIVSDLQAAGHQPLAVEMEGAAVAQVCLDYGVAFAAMRTISDRADDSAHEDFQTFVAQVASPIALNVMQAYLELISKKEQ